MLTYIYKIQDVGIFSTDSKPTWGHTQRWYNIIKTGNQNKHERKFEKKTHILP